MFDQSPREFYELIKSELGPRYAWWGLALFYVAGVIGLLAAIGAAVYWTEQHLLAPVLSAIANKVGLPANLNFLPTAISVTVTTILFVLFTLWALRRLQSFEQKLLEGIRSTVNFLEERLRKVEESSLALAAIDERVKSIETAKSGAELEKLLAERYLEAQKKNRLQIISAHYGISSHGYANVTEAVQGWIVNDEINKLVENPTIGLDPVPGHRKELVVRFTFDGVMVQHKKVIENERLLISKPVG